MPLDVVGQPWGEDDLDARRHGRGRVVEGRRDETLGGIDEEVEDVTPVVLGQTPPILHLVGGDEAHEFTGGPARESDAVTTRENLVAAKWGAHVKRLRGAAHREGRAHGFNTDADHRHRGSTFTFNPEAGQSS